MIILVESGNLAAIKALLVSIPESAGVLVFGVVLVTAAVSVRWLLSRFDEKRINA
jgi:hypothetical protein